LSFGYAAAAPLHQVAEEGGFKERIYTKRNLDSSKSDLAKGEIRCFVMGVILPADNMIILHYSFFILVLSFLPYCCFEISKTKLNVFVPF